MAEALQVVREAQHAVAEGSRLSDAAERPGMRGGSTRENVTVSAPQLRPQASSGVPHAEPVLENVRAEKDPFSV